MQEQSTVLVICHLFDKRFIKIINVILNSRVVFNGKSTKHCQRYYKRFESKDPSTVQVFYKQFISNIRRAS